MDQDTPRFESETTSTIEQPSTLDETLVPGVQPVVRADERKVSTEIVPVVDEPVLPWQPYMSEIQRLCEVKAEDFHLLGYGEVQPQEIWDCVKSSFKGQLRLHDLVAAVMGLQVGKFMNWMTMRAYRGTLEGDVFGR